MATVEEAEVTMLLYLLRGCIVKDSTLISALKSQNCERSKMAAVFYSCSCSPVHLYSVPMSKWKETLLQFGITRKLDNDSDKDNERKEPMMTKERLGSNLLV